MPLNISMESNDDFIARKLDEISRKYLSVCNGIDPVTGKQIYVDCEVGESTYRMNAGRVAAETLRSGVVLAESNNLTDYFLINFYDTKFEPVAMDVVREVNRLQGNDAAVHYLTKQSLKAAVNAATTVAEAQAVNISFAVKVE